MCPKLNEIKAFFPGPPDALKTKRKKKKTREGKIVYLDLLMSIIVI